MGVTVDEYLRLKTPQGAPEVSLNAAIKGEQYGIGEVVKAGTHLYAAADLRTVFELPSGGGVQSTATAGTWVEVLRTPYLFATDRHTAQIYWRRSNCDVRVTWYETDGTTLQQQTTNNQASGDTEMEVGSSITERVGIVVVEISVPTSGTAELEMICGVELPLEEADLP